MKKKKQYDLDHFAFQPLKVISMISTATDLATFRCHTAPHGKDPAEREAPRQLVLGFDWMCII